MPDLAALSLPVILALFAAAAALVWGAGTRLSRYADGISEATGIGRTLIGLLLLAGVTSLPEISVSTVSAAVGDAHLAVNNLFGSVAMQVAVLAIVDFYIGRRALTSVVPDPTPMLLGSLNVLLLAFAAAGIIAGDVAVAGAGIWGWGCLLAYVGSVWLLVRAQGRQPWLAQPSAAARDAASPRIRGGEPAQDTATRLSLRTAIIRTVAAAAIILFAGYVLSRTGSAIAEKTGIGSSFVGFVLLAVSTSLPEVSAALSAARLGRFAMAISGILGTNMINVGLLFVVDIVAPGPPVLDQVGAFASFGALLGIVVTTAFLIGLAERRDRTVGRMGFDSLAVLIAYVGGLFILYGLRSSS